MTLRAELVKVIEDVRRRWRTKLLLRGGLVVLGGVVLTLVLASSGLQALAFAPKAILGFRVAVFTIFAALVAIWIFRPMRRTVTDDQVALYIEEQDPSLREELLTAADNSTALRSSVKSPPRTAPPTT